MCVKEVPVIRNFRCVPQTNLHLGILNSIKSRLTDFGITQKYFFWSMIEGEFQPNGHKVPFPDLIIFLKDHEKSRQASEAIPIELKTGKYSEWDRLDAIDQLWYGARFAIDVQRANVDYGLFITSVDDCTLKPERIYYEELEKSNRVHEKCRGLAGKMRGVIRRH